jgi:hypothetical protein
MRTESREAGVYLRLATATALTFAIPVGHMADGKPVDPMKRYSYFVTAHQAGKLFPFFDKAQTWELRYVVSSWARDEDMDWVRGKVDAKLKNQESIGDACWMVPYRDTNAKGVSVQEGSKYYDFKPMTLQLMVEVGGVCGAISRFGTSVCNAFGIPAMPLGQPGHCAHVWRNKDGSWKLGQDIFGWAQSSQHDGMRILYGGRPSYLLLYDAAVADPQAFLLSQRLMWVADLYKARNDTARHALLEQSVKANGANLAAVREYLTCAKELPDKAKFAEAIKLSLAGLRDNPYAVSDTMRELSAPALSSLVSDAVSRGLVEAVFKTIADGSPEKQVGCGWWAETEYLDFVAKTVTASQNDFLTSARTGKDAQGLWEKLNNVQRANWLMSLEFALRTGMARKDLYESVLNLYAELAEKDASSSGRGLATLGVLANKAIASKVKPFGADACRKLAEICDKTKDHLSAENWRKLAAGG